MKEYKFRVWDYDAKKMYYQDELIITFDKVGEDVYVYKNGTVEPLYNYELMQYIGRADVNRVSIYKGDIVKVINYFKEEKGRVVYDNEDACYYVMQGNEYNNMKMCFDGDDDYFYKVIGNIYENPELLEVDYEN